MEGAWRTEDVGPERAPGSDARLMEYLILGLASVVSPFMAFAEPLAVYFGLTGALLWWPAAITIAAGQTVGFMLLYLFGAQLRARIGWLRRRFEVFDFSRLGHGRTAITASSGALGMPPAIILAVAGPMYDPRGALFLGTIFVTRVARFSVLAGLPAAFGSFFDPAMMPEWIRGIFGG